MGDKKIGKKNAAKRKPPWFLGAFVLGLLILLFVFNSSNLWRSLSVSSSSETLLLYALSSLNFIAFIIFALILIRSLLKLRQERRTSQLGSKMKKRLLVYFCAVTLLPLIAMAVFSYLFMNRALERWFTQIPENVVRQAGELQDESVENQRNKAKSTVQMLAALLDQRGTDQATLDLIRERGNLALIEVVDGSHKTLISSATKPDPQSAKEFSDVMTLLRNGKFDDESLSDGNGYDAAIAQLKDGSTLLVVPAAGPKGTVGELVKSSLVEFDNLKSSNRFVRQLGLSVLALLTFLLIFASSWTALYVAKGITRPIRALAEGADRIAHGDFSHRVDVWAEDELDMLVHAFNTMTGKLEENSAELDERRRYIETILQSLSAGVISFDADNGVTTINKAAIRMMRLEDADFTGFSIAQLVTRDNQINFEKLILRALRTGRANEQSVLFRENTDRSNVSSEEVTVALSVAALPDKNGTVLVIEDLSELMSAQRAAAWQEVARRMAHEIKNPLTPIQLSAERIAKRIRSGANGVTDSNADFERTTAIVNEGTDTILREVATLKSMVDEFSRFARLPDANKQEIDAVDVIRQSAALYEGRKPQTEILISIENELPLLMADHEQLKRVFVNLIDNALESFDEDAEERIVSIKAIYEKPREIIRIELSDLGAGVNPADIPKLFQPYFSTKGRGTGLGLAIVYRIIRDHDGKIAVAANRPRGTKFTIELPV